MNAKNFSPKDMILDWYFPNIAFFVKWYPQTAYKVMVFGLSF